MKGDKSSDVVAKGLFFLAVTIIVLFIILFTISGGFMKQNYLNPWSKEYSKRYSDPRIRLAARGILAASGHNMQPWTLKYDPTDSMSFYLYANRERITKEVDPEYRQMMISQGTFLEYVLVAGEKEGWNVQIKLFPNGEYDEGNLVHSMDTLPVAKITLESAQPEDTPLYNAMFMPDTNRMPYWDHELSPYEISSLESVSETSDISIKVYKELSDRSYISTCVMKSATTEAGVPRVMEETNTIFRPNEHQKNQYRYGFSVEGQGTSGLMKPVLQGMLTIFPSLNSGKAASQNFIKSTQTSVDSTPAYVMIVTERNDRATQVRSGMIYSQIVLTGHTMGLAMQPLSQVLEEYPEMNSLYTEFKQKYTPEGGTIQMLLRTGYPKKRMPRSMRQDIMDFFVKQ
jgi:hypothetical protein